MSELLGFGALAAVLAGVVTATVVPLVSRLAFALRAVDLPGERRAHHGEVPRLGGVAIAVGIALGAGSVALVQWGEWGSRVVRSELVAFVVATAIVFLVGLADDLVGVSVGQKFLAQTLAAVLIVLIGWEFSAVSLPHGTSLDLGFAGKVLTVLWIVGVTNAINLVDGLDGLAGGVVAIIAGSVLVFAVMQQNVFTVVLMAATAGACLGFLRHNWRGAIFLGDAGSLSLGFVLAVMTVHGSLKARATVAILVPLLALGVPVIDTLLVMLVRFVGRPHSGLAERFLGMFRADRNHLHHLMESYTGSRPRVVRWIYVMVAVFCLLALVIAVTRNVAAGFVLLGVELAAVALVRRLGLAARMREMSAAKQIALRELVSAGEDGRSQGGDGPRDEPPGVS